LPWWASTTIAAGGMGAEDNASGLSVALEPLRPSAVWRRTIEGSGAGPALVASGSGAQTSAAFVPFVDAVRRVGDGSVLVSGPLNPRAGLVAAASWRSLSHVVERSATTTTERVGSGFAHVVFSATPRDEIRFVGWGQRATTAAYADTAVHLQ